MFSSNVTHRPRLRVTGAARAISRLLARRRANRLPDKVLAVLDLAARADAQVYEDSNYHSWAVTPHGHVFCVSRQVDRLYSGRHPMLTPGGWSGVGEAARRPWLVTAYGHLTLTAAGRRRPAIVAGVS